MYWTIESYENWICMAVYVSEKSQWMDGWVMYFVLRTNELIWIEWKGDEKANFVVDLVAGKNWRWMDLKVIVRRSVVN